MGTVDGFGFGVVFLAYGVALGYTHSPLNDSGYVELP